MPHRHIAALLAAQLLHAAAVADNGIDAVHLAVADRHIIPAYEQLAIQTKQLDASATGHCDTGTPGRPVLQQRYADAFLAWQAVQHIRFGPIQVLNRGYRYQLWPDKRGSVGKHLRKLLATPDATRLEPEAFAGGSVAVQGFSALERLLFDNRGVDDAMAQAWRCDVIRAITDNLMRMSAALVREWRDGPDAHRLLFSDASRGNAYYESATEVSATLLNKLHTQLELIAAQKLARPLGRGPDKAFPKCAEAWRSGLALPAVRANLRACLALYETGFAPRLKDQALRHKIGEHFEYSLRKAAQIDRTMRIAITDPTGYQRLQQLRRQVSALNRLISGDLASELGLQLGFNSLDGD